MIIAETSLGKPISLYLATYSSPFITHLRTQPLRCPSCKCSVIVKSGQKVMPHFAHKSKAACSGFSENESLLHLKAKTELNRWLSLQSFQPELEKNYALVNRRADISVRYLNSEYAVEFQCSPISIKLMRKRSSDYRTIGVIPFWILPSELIQKAKILKLTAFLQQFIRFSQSTGQYYLLAYSPEEKSFTIYNHLTPLSKSMFITSYTTLPQKEIHFPAFPIKQFNMTEQLYAIHLKMNEKWILNTFKYRRSIRDPLMRRLYETNISLLETPPWIGILLKSNMYFSDSPIEWQMYLYIIMRKEITFFKQQLIDELKQLIYSRVLHVRNIMEEISVDISEKAVTELIHVLLICGVLERSGSGLKVIDSSTYLNNQEHNRSANLLDFHEQAKTAIIQEYNRR